MKRLLLWVLISGVAFAQAASSGTAKTKTATAKSHHAMKSMASPMIMTPDELKWMDAPPVFQSGAKMAVVSGDPMKAGMFTIRLKAPDGYKVMPHWHPTAEMVTVISGEADAGMGKKWDDSSMKALPAGSVAVLPAHQPHYVTTKGETELQVSGMGPFKLTYVNPADNPEKK